MYLSKLTLKQNKMTAQWAANPYRVHQRLMMACDQDPRLLFRIEETATSHHIIVQSHQEPSWDKAFSGLKVLETPILCKVFNPVLETGCVYRFLLKANPTVKKSVLNEEKPRKTRLGILTEAGQIEWLRRKLADGGAELINAEVVKQEFQHSHKKEVIDQQPYQTHLAVVFEGLLQVLDPTLLFQTLDHGIGSAKGYGFGLLSLARPG